MARKDLGTLSTARRIILPGANAGSWNILTSEEMERLFKIDHFQESLESLRAYAASHKFVMRQDRNVDAVDTLDMGQNRRKIIMRKIIIGLLIASGAVLTMPAAQSANWNGENASGMARSGYNTSGRSGPYMARANSGAMMRTGHMDRGWETPGAQDQRRLRDKAVGRGF